MKKLLIIIVFLYSFNLLSQSYPKLYKYNDSTFVIFTVNQAKEVYKNTVLLDRYEKMELKNKEIELIDINIEKIEVNKDSLIKDKSNTLKEENKMLKKKIRRMKFKNKLVMIGSIVIIILVII